MDPNTRLGRHEIPDLEAILQTIVEVDAEVGVNDAERSPPHVEAKRHAMNDTHTL